MDPTRGSHTISLAEPGAARSEADLVEALAARVEEIDARLRETAIVADEKALKELRRTLEALSKRDPKFEERVTNRVDVVADRLETTAKTVSTTAAALAARDGEIAQLRRDLEAATARVDAALADLRRSFDPSAVGEIRAALASLSDRKLPRGVDGRIEELGAKVARLAQRIDTVSSTVSTTAAGLAGRDGDMIALRRAFEVDVARVDGELAEVRRALDPTPVNQLRDAVASLSERSAVAAQEGRRGLEEIRLGLTATTRTVDELSSRAAALVGSLGAADAKISEVDARLAADRDTLSALGVELHGLVAALAGRVSAIEDDSALGADLQRAIAALSARVAALEDETTADELRAVQERLERDAARFEEMTERLGALEAATAAAVGQVSASSRMLDELVAASARIPELEARVAAGHEALPALGEELHAAVAALAARVAPLEEQTTADELRAVGERLEREAGRFEEMAVRLGALEQSVVAATARETEKERELALLETRFAEAGSRVDALVGDLRGALETMPAPAVPELESALADLTARVAGLDDRLRGLEGAYISAEAGVSEVVRDLEEQLAGAVARVASVESDRGAAAAELAHTTAFWSGELGSLDARLGAVLGSLDDLGRQLDAGRSRLDLLGDPRLVLMRLDEIARRLDSLERIRDDVGQADTPGAGDGRFRLELRALELRMDHAEAAARESREAVLMQLERLGSRIDGRLERLETEPEADSRAEVETTTEVVPFRSGDP